MRFCKLIRSSLVGLTSLAILLPQPVAFAEAAAGAAAQRSKAAESPKIRDVELGAKGTLSGQLVTPQGTPVKEAEIQLVHFDGVAATTTTNADGKFNMQGIGGGTYVIDASNARSLVRLWTPGTAPPAAAKGALLISPGQTVRGRIPNFGGVSDGVFRWDEFGGFVIMPLVIGGGLLIYDRTDGS